MRRRRWRRRTIHVALLDRQLAESDAIRRALGGGRGHARVASSERIVDPATGEHLWAVVVEVRRALPRL